jgi:catechol 2,3-dioxygenase-like lactoylglutathione lyase family enzyme
MLGDYDAISFIATLDPPAAREFYEHVLGLPFVAETEFETTAGDAF